MRDINLFSTTDDRPRRLRFWRAAAAKRRCGDFFAGAGAARDLQTLAARLDGIAVRFEVS